MQDKLRIREKQHRNIGNLIRSTYFFWFSILKILISWKSLQILTKNFFSFLSARRVHHNTEIGLFGVVQGVPNKRIEFEHAIK